MRVAKATQRPGQTKEQTKLIAQGIQKGIDQYKKQQKEKSRQLNKKIQKVSRTMDALDKQNEPVVEQQSVVYKQSKLAWVLLGCSWLGMGVYLFLSA